jgi:glycosyltransferase involved in cell wall biosynthesis
MINCSVVIPNYNHAPFLIERIKSLITQTLINVEYIILDDASEDNSLDIINEFMPRLTDSKLIVNEINSGSTYSQWNLGISYAKNNFIHVAESDDSAEPEHLYNLCNKLETNREVVLSFCKSNVIDMESKFLHEWEYEDPIFNSDFIMDGSLFIEKYLIHKNVIPNASSVVFRKDIFLKVGLADPSLKSNSDWLVWLKLLTHGKVAYSCNPLNNFRKHDTSVIAKINNSPMRDYNEMYSQSLRIRYKKYLLKETISDFGKINHVNKNYISFDLGHRSLYLLKNKKYIQSIYVLMQSLFTGSIKTYFLKKYLLDFSNYLFKK